MASVGDEIGGSVIGHVQADHRPQDRDSTVFLDHQEHRGGDFNVTQTVATLDGTDSNDAEVARALASLLRAEVCA